MAKLRTYHLNDPHKRMLLGLRELLYSLDDLLVVLALHRDRDRQAAHYERRVHVVILRNRLQVRHLQGTRRLVKHFGEVLGHQPVELLERREPQDPVV